MKNKNYTPSPDTVYYERDYRYVIYGIAFIIALGVLVAFGFRGGIDRPRTPSIAPSIHDGLGSEPLPAHDGACTKIGESRYDCTDEQTKLRIYELYRDGSLAPKPVSVTMTIIQTKYSRADSCHNPKGNKCLTAIGRDTVEGRTVACPRSLPLGTHILLGGKEYVCEDRYATRLDKKRAYPTIDVFAEQDNLKNLPSFKVTEITIL